MAEKAKIADLPAKPKTEQAPSVGRVVHYVMPNGRHRPATIVEVFENFKDMVNLQVLLDGPNDPSPFSGNPNSNYATAASQWCGSVYRDEIDKLVGTYHFPEYVPAREA